MLDKTLWNELEGVCRQLGPRPHYLPNQGNAGDALIAAGTWQFFDDLKMEPQVCSRRAVKQGDTVIYAGGGNLVPEYNNCAKFLARCLQVGVKRALVLPHSVMGHTELLSRLDQRFTIVCREKASVERVLATGTGARVLEAPDMALRLDVETLRRRCSGWSFTRDLAAHLVLHGKVPAYIHWRASLKRLAPLRGEHVSVIRADVEAKSGVDGDPRWDLSSLYGSKFRSRAESDQVALDLIEFLSRVKSVQTNRLHVGVAAMLVGASVRYLDNSYGKIRAVYDASMTQIPGVSFVNS